MAFPGKEEDLPSVSEHIKCQWGGIWIGGSGGQGGEHTGIFCGAPTIDCSHHPTSPITSTIRRAGAGEGTEEQDVSPGSRSWKETMSSNRLARKEAGSAVSAGV